MKRYTYDINEPEDFEKLLKSLAKTELYPPIFVEWVDVEGSASAKAVYWLEADLYRARLTIEKPSPEEVVATFQARHEKDHEFIECLVSASHDE